MYSSAFILTMLVRPKERMDWQWVIVTGEQPVLVTSVSFCIFSPEFY